MRRLHDGHGCEHEGHSCGCPHSASYDFDWAPDGDLAERWSEAALTSLLHFIERLEWSLPLDEIETRLDGGGAAKTER